MRAAAVRLGLAGFTRATAINIAIGLFWLGTLPPERIRMFAGGDAVATTLLALGIGLGIWALWPALGLPRRALPHPRRLVRPAAVVLVTMVLMVLVRDQLRSGMLDPFAVTPTTVAPRWGMIGPFAACLVLAGAAIVCMVRAYARSPAESRQRTAAGV